MDNNINNENTETSTNAKDFNDVTDEDFFEAIANFDWVKEGEPDYLADGSCCTGKYGK